MCGKWPDCCHTDATALRVLRLKVSDYLTLTDRLDVLEKQLSFGALRTQLEELRYSSCFDLKTEGKWDKLKILDTQLPPWSTHGPRRAQIIAEGGWAPNLAEFCFDLGM